jgi:hypothetical protein
MESNSPFRFAKHIRQGDPLTPDEMKEFQPYLMNKLYYYSGYERYANLLNILWSLPKEFQYKLFCVLFKGVWPKGWIKSTKDNEKKQIEVEYLKKKYQVSTKIAMEYVNLLTIEEKKEIKRKFEC